MMKVHIEVSWITCSTVSQGSFKSLRVDLHKYRNEWNPMAFLDNQINHRFSLDKVGSNLKYVMSQGHIVNLMD